jgi:hypothetical protein
VIPQGWLPGSSSRRSSSQNPSSEGPSSQGSSSEGGFASRAERESLALVLYSKPDCPLCDELEHALAALAHAQPHTLRKVDIRGDAALAERYGRSIPVLEHAGRVLCKGRVDAAALERRLARARAGLGD